MSATETEEKAPACADEHEPVCSSECDRYPFYNCSLKAEHFGDHVALDAYGHREIARWPQ